MKTFDIPRAMGEVLDLATCISPEFTRWMNSQSEWQEVYSSCPNIDVDTVVVAASTAWCVYKKCPIYVCRAGRFFRDAEYLAFYKDASIKSQIPKILAVRDDVSFTAEEAKRLEDTGDDMDLRLAKAIRWALSDEGWETSGGWGWDRFKVFMLTPWRDDQPGNDGHVVLKRDVPHQTTGRGTAFTQGQRYVSLHRLMVAESTKELLLRPSAD